MNGDHIADVQRAGVIISRYYLTPTEIATAALDELEAQKKRATERLHLIEQRIAAWTAVKKGAADGAW